MWAKRAKNYTICSGSPCIAKWVKTGYSGEVSGRKQKLILSFLSLFLWGPALALTGPQCITVCEAGSMEELKAMAAEHTAAELFRVRDGSGRGLLHLCLQRGDQYWKALLDLGWDVSAEKGWTPQHEAALLGKLEAMKALLAKGGEVSPREPFNGGTPLHVAAFNGHFEVVKLLVSKGAAVNARDKEGWTPLAQARDQGFPEIVDWLKKNGAVR